MGNFLSTLARLEARIGLAKNIHPPATAHDLAVGVTVLQGLEGRGYFHGKTI
jgi:hypothetical protein